MQRAMVTIEWPGVNVAAVAPVARKVTAAVERLWITGRLRHITDTAEGREIVALFEEAHKAFIGQIAEADASGKQQVTLRVTIDIASGRVAAGFTRGLIALFADAATMAAAGAEPFTPDEVRVCEELLARAEGVLAGSADRL